MERDTRNIFALAISLIVSALIVSLPVWLIWLDCCPPARRGASLTKEFRWDTENGDLVEGDASDSLEIWLELDGQEVAGTRRQLGPSDWRVTWTGLDDTTYDIVYTYTHEEAEPESGSGSESILLQCHPTVVNVLEREEPKRP